MSQALTCAAPRRSSATVTAPAPQPASITSRPSTRGSAETSACVNGEGVCTPGDTLIARGSPSSQMTASVGAVRLPPACVLTVRQGTGADTRRFRAWTRSQTSSRTWRSSAEPRATPSPPTAATWRSCRSSCARARSRSTTRPPTISRRSRARSSAPDCPPPRAAGGWRLRARCCATAAASARGPWTRARSWRCRACRSACRACCRSSRPRCSSSIPTPRRSDCAIAPRSSCSTAAACASPS